MALVLDIINVIVTLISIIVTIRSIKGQNDNK